MRLDRRAQKSPPVLTELIRLSGEAPGSSVKFGAGATTGYLYLKVFNGHQLPKK
jgi:hypothetical protein